MRKLIMPSKKSDDWFEKELAALQEGLARLEASIDPAALAAGKAAGLSRPRPRRKVRQPAPKPAATTIGGGLAKAEAAIESPRAVETKQSVVADAPAPSPAPPAVLPTGTDLAQPKEFGRMPVAADLERGAATDDEYRARLTQQLKFAHQVLHTSGVVAAVWREWRAFERVGQERLRLLNARPSSDEDQDPR